MTKAELDNAVRRALNIFDSWNQVTGCFSEARGYYNEMQLIIEDAVHCGAQAETKDFKRLESEDDVYPVAGCPHDLPERNES